MYLSYYKLRLKPFQISTNPRFLWLGEKHQEAFATLRYGVLDSKGFLLLTGDVGTGKTTLVNALLKTLSSDAIVATVRDPSLEPLDFFNFIANVFEMNQEFASKGTFLIQFSRFLHDAYYQGKKVLLIIDEAQRIKQELFEEIRMLSNIELDDAKLLNIFFVGQNEFNNILLLPENRAIRQRITVNYHLFPLTKKETATYINHRLKIAGAATNPFQANAMPEIHAFAKGYPRLINIICDRALLTGFVEESKKINAAIIKECASELKIPHHPQNITVSSPDLATAHTSSFSRAKVKTKKTAGNMIIIMIILVVLLTFGSYLLLRQQPLNLLWLKPPVTILQDNNVDKYSRPEPKEPANHQIAQQEEIVNKSSSPPSLLSFEKLIISFSRNSIMPDADSMKQLNILTNQIRLAPDLLLIVRGYTDSSGNAQQNKRLSKFRADTVKSYLIGRGVNKTQITAIGLGDMEPIASNETREGREKNRRVEIEVITP